MHAIEALVKNKMTYNIKQNKKMVKAVVSLPVFFLDTMYIDMIIYMMCNKYNINISILIIKFFYFAYLNFLTHCIHVHMVYIE